MRITDVWNDTGYDFFIRASYSSTWQDINMAMLDVQGASTSQGAKVVGWSFHGGDNQQWQFSTQLTDNNP